MSTDQKLTELEVEFKCIKCEILGLVEVRRKGENRITLESGHLLNYGGEEDNTQEEVDLIINKKTINSTVFPQES